MNYKEAEYYRELMLNSDINYFLVIEKYNKANKILSDLWSRNERDSQTQDYNLYLYNIKYYYSPLIDYWECLKDFYGLVLDGIFLNRKEANNIACSITRPYYTSPIY